MDVMSCWCVIRRISQFHIRSITNFKESLYDSFSKCCLSNQRSGFIIFDRTRRISAALALLPLTNTHSGISSCSFFCVFVIFLITILIFSINNRSFWKNLSCNIYYTCQQTTRIIPKIYDQFLCHLVFLRLFSPLRNWLTVTSSNSVI